MPITASAEVFGTPQVRGGTVITGAGGADNGGVWRSFQDNGSQTAFNQIYNAMINDRNARGWGGVTGGFPASLSEAQFASWLSSSFGNNLGFFCQNSNTIYMLVNAELYNGQIRSAGVFSSEGGLSSGLPNDTRNSSWNNISHITVTHDSATYNMRDLVSEHPAWQTGRSVLWCSAGMSDFALDIPDYQCTGQLRWQRTPEYDQIWNAGGLSGSGRLGWKHDLFAQYPADAPLGYINARLNQVSSPGGVNRCSDRPTDGWCTTPLQEWLTRDTWIILRDAINNPNNDNIALNRALNDFLREFSNVLEA
jgi:hypothetical protein